MKYALAAIAIIGFVLAKPIWLYSTEAKVDVVVTKVDRECRNDDGCRYVVYTDSEVFINKDSFWFFKFNSSDIQNQLNNNTNKPVTLTVTGIRFGFFSWYRNIVGVDQ